MLSMSQQLLAQPPTRRGPAKVLDRMRHDSRFLRLALLSMTAAAVLAIMIAAAVFTDRALTSSAKTPDRLAAATGVLAGATLLLAVIAALVALLAYAVSTGTPDIRLRVEFEGSRPNNLSFGADKSSSGKALSFPLTQGRISLWNKSGYSAVNPAVVIRLHAILPHADPVQIESGWSWSPYDRGKIQWDGGPTYSIHGHSTRVLNTPVIPSAEHLPDWGTPILGFEILAEGYRKLVIMPLELIVDSKTLYPRRKPKPEWT
jgi:hypothetical protein